jgi:hypothetical protein
LGHGGDKSVTLDPLERQQRGRANAPAPSVRPSSRGEGIGIDDDCPGSAALLTQIRLPGDGYLEARAAQPAQPRLVGPGLKSGAMPATVELTRDAGIIVNEVRARHETPPLVQDDPVRERATESGLDPPPAVLGLLG